MRSSHAVRWTLASALASGALGACRQTLGIDQYSNAPADAGTGESGVSACGLPYGTNVCASCVHASCCDASSTCATDVPCAAYFQCLGACKIGDWQCRSQCRIDHPIGAATEFPALMTCMATKCESECGLTCGGIGALFAAPSAAAACQTCFQTNSCASALGCASSSDCTGWLQCFGACTTPDCRAACAVRYGYADGGSLISSPPGPPALSAVTGACSTACGIGRNWSCVGHVVWPATSAGTTLTTQVIDFGTGQPVSGATVSICRLLNQGCSSPLAPQAQSDASGTVVLYVPPPANGIASLGSDSYAQITSPATGPALYFLGYPVSEPRANIANPYVLVLTPSELQQIQIDTGLPFDSSTLGWIQAVVYDCDGAPAPGVQLTIDVKDPSVIPYYNAGNVPSPTATATDSAGAGYGGGFLNVRPGVVTVTATPLALGGKPASRGPVLVRPGTHSVLFMYPTP